jgi:oxygen-independent coproporphyrinogen-3 oxidase
VLIDPRTDSRALGLYVHFPWCIKKCPYCDFNSHPLKETTDQDAYLEALLSDWQHQYELLGQKRLAETPSENFTSIFFGGGTPSLFKPDHLHRLMREIPHRAAEITLEVNPGSSEYFRFEDYQAAGINRLSIGAQSFSNTQLAALGRVHQMHETLQALERARHAGFDNINLDLMWGLPGQTVAGALADLQQAIDLSPEHISWYQLTIEAKTEFARRPPLLPKDGFLQDIEAAGLELLADAGFERYEVSAFAKPNKQCIHNLTYWSFGDYLGIGAGAHGKVRVGDHIMRTQRPSQPRLYQQDPTTIAPAPVSTEQLGLEFMMNALRLIDGVEQAVFEERTNMPWHDNQAVWGELVALDLVASDRCATTPLGLRYLDSVLERFL